MISAEPQRDKDAESNAKKIADEALNKLYGPTSKFAINAASVNLEIRNNSILGPAFNNVNLSNSGVATSLFPSTNVTSEEENHLYDADMTSPSREEMKHALQASQSEASAITEKLRADFAEHRGDMKAAVETLRADMHKASADNIKWVIGTMIALLAVTISVLSFVINNAAKVPQAQQPQQQQPVIVNVMPSAQPAAVPSAK